MGYARTENPGFDRSVEEAADTGADTTLGFACAFFRRAATAAAAAAFNFAAAAWEAIAWGETGVEPTVPTFTTDLRVGDELSTAGRQP
jgi:hypothetical protein